MITRRYLISVLRDGSWQSKRSRYQYEWSAIHHAEGIARESGCDTMVLKLSSSTEPFRVMWRSNP